MRGQFYDFYDGLLFINDDKHCNNKKDNSQASYPSFCVLFIDHYYPVDHE